MALCYIIDGYNVIKHSDYPGAWNKFNDQRFGLARLIRNRHLAGSLKNKVVLVFDGYPDKSYSAINEPGVEVVFSREESADSRIKRMLEAKARSENLIVVSDDLEIGFYAKSAGVKLLKVSEFIHPRKKASRESRGREQEFSKELSYSQRSKIDHELRQIWLKE